jgi:hypothetical protein
MPRPSDIITTVATVLMNDYAQTQYTNTVCLPALNLALDELQEIYEQNGLPITNETSAAITILSSSANTKIITDIGFDTVPALPSDLIEIQQLWESPTGLNQWTEMVKKEFIPNYLKDGTQIAQFLIWAWEHGRIKLITANQNNDLKIDYTASMFNTPILIKDVNVNLPFVGVKTYLEYKTGAICAMFIAENESRAQALDSLAGTALTRALGIPIKGMQSIVTRRRPFRHSFKHRGVSY